MEPNGQEIKPDVEQLQTFERFPAQNDPQAVEQAIKRENERIQASAPLVNLKSEPADPNFHSSDQANLKSESLESSFHSSGSLLNSQPQGLECTPDTAQSELDTEAKILQSKLNALKAEKDVLEDSECQINHQHLESEAHGLECQISPLKTEGETQDLQCQINPRHSLYSEAQDLECQINPRPSGRETQDLQNSQRNDCCLSNSLSSASRPEFIPEAMKDMQPVVLLEDIGKQKSFRSSNENIIRRKELSSDKHPVILLEDIGKQKSFRSSNENIIRRKELSSDKHPVILLEDVGKQKSFRSSNENIIRRKELSSDKHPVILLEDVGKQKSFRSSNENIIRRKELSSDKQPVILLEDVGKLKSFRSSNENIILSAQPSSNQQLDELLEDVGRQKSFRLSNENIIRPEVRSSNHQSDVLLEDIGGQKSFHSSDENIILSAQPSSDHQPGVLLEDNGMQKSFHSSNENIIHLALPLSNQQPENIILSAWPSSNQQPDVLLEDIGRQKSFHSSNENINRPALPSSNQLDDRSRGGDAHPQSVRQAEAEPVKVPESVPAENDESTQDEDSRPSLSQYPTTSSAQKRQAQQRFDSNRKLLLVLGNWADTASVASPSSSLGTPEHSSPKVAKRSLSSIENEPIPKIAEKILSEHGLAAPSKTSLEILVPAAPLSKNASLAWEALKKWRTSEGSEPGGGGSATPGSNIKDWRPKPTNDFLQLSLLSALQNRKTTQTSAATAVLALTQTGNPCRTAHSSAVVAEAAKNLSVSVDRSTQDGVNGAGRSTSTETAKDLRTQDGSEKSPTRSKSSKDLPEENGGRSHPKGKRAGTGMGLMSQTSTKKAKFSPNTTVGYSVKTRSASLSDKERKDTETPAAAGGVGDKPHPPSDSEHSDTKCRFCEKELVSKASRRRHESSNTKSTEHKCLMCGELFYAKCQWKDHMAAVHLRKVEEARGSTATQDDGGGRRNKATNTTVSVAGRNCPWCDNVFYFKDELKRHSAIARILFRNAGDSSSNPMDHTTRKCPMCGKVVDTRRLWKKHLAGTHSATTGLNNTAQDDNDNDDDDDDSEREEDAGKVCNFCGERFSSEEMLEDHVSLQARDPPYSHLCAACGLGFIADCQLQRHASLAHTGPESAPSDMVAKPGSGRDLEGAGQQQRDVESCTICRQTFQTERTLFLHFKEVHAELTMGKGKGKGKCWRYFCTLCAVAYYTVSEFRQHFKAGRPHTCFMCTEIFSVRCDFKSHMKDHFRKPPECFRCEHTFPSWDDCEIHFMDVHLVRTSVTRKKNVGSNSKVGGGRTRGALLERLYKCYCGQDFYHVKDLRFHARLHQQGGDRLEGGGEHPPHLNADGGEERNGTNGGGEENGTNGGGEKNGTNGGGEENGTNGGGEENGTNGCGEKNGTNGCGEKNGTNGCGEKNGTNGCGEKNGTNGCGEKNGTNGCGEKNGTNGCGEKNGTNGCGEKNGTNGCGEKNGTNGGGEENGTNGGGEENGTNGGGEENGTNGGGEENGTNGGGEKNGTNGCGEKNGTNGGGEKNETNGGGEKNETNGGGEKNETNGGGEKNETNGGGEKNGTNGGGEKNETNGGGEKNGTNGGGEKNETNGGGEKNGTNGGGEKNETNGDGEENGTNGGGEKNGTNGCGEKNGTNGFVEPERCKLCNVRFVLRVDRTIHVPERPYMCGVCEFPCRTLCLLKIHVSYMHGSDLEAEAGYKKLPKSTGARVNTALARIKILGSGDGTGFEQLIVAYPNGRCVQLKKPPNKAGSMVQARESCQRGKNPMKPGLNETGNAMIPALDTPAERKINPLEVSVESGDAVERGTSRIQPQTLDGAHNFVQEKVSEKGGGSLRSEDSVNSRENQAGGRDDLQPAIVNDGEDHRQHGTGSGGGLDQAENSSLLQNQFCRRKITNDAVGTSPVGKGFDASGTFTLSKTLSPHLGPRRLRKRRRQCPRQHAEDSSFVWDVETTRFHTYRCGDCKQRFALEYDPSVRRLLSKSSVCAALREFLDADGRTGGSSQPQCSACGSELREF